MSRNLIDLLEVDHDRIRALKEEVRALFAQEPVNEKIIFDRLKTLQALVLAHSRAEELALYSLFRHGRSTKAAELRHFSVDALEEHHLIEQALEEVLEVRHLDRMAHAKFSVVNTLLDHHLDGEEEDFFPGVKLLLGGSELASLAEVYARKRDQEGRQILVVGESPSLSI